MDTNEKFMRAALKEAAKGGEIKEVPVGCVIVRDGKIITRAHNLKFTKGDPLLHAEIVAIQKAVKKTGDWRLNECDMFVTLEPCPMCAGAIINSRIGRLFFGAYDPKAGCTGTLYNLPVDKRFNHRAEVTGGILESECGEILSRFFKERRNAGV